MLSVDGDGHAILTNFPRRIVLHHFSLKGDTTALSFSPSGRYFAVGIGRIIEVWHTPSTPESTSEEGLEFAPFVRHHAHAGHHDTVQSIEWSGDSRFFLSASKDLTARIWSLNSEHGFVPTTLAGHREGLLGAWFSNDQELVRQYDALGSCLLTQHRFIQSAKTARFSVGNTLKRPKLMAAATTLTTQTPLFGGGSCRNISSCRIMQRRDAQPTMLDLTFSLPASQTVFSACMSYLGLT